MQDIYNNQLHWIKACVQPFYEKEQFRCFHNFKHIEEGLKCVSRLKHQYSEIALSDEQFVAWLFHDIVYLPGSENNEFISAETMKEFCLEHNVDIDIEIAYTIIMDTKSHKPTITQSELVLDMDMSTLGQGQYICFFKDRLMVKMEYGHFFDAATCDKGVLDFLISIQREKIFHTDYFSVNQTHFERNVKRYIEENRA